MDTDVIIIGGGLAGLSCAVKLAQRGVDFQILEATDRLGGRVRTDRVDGYLLDHGFQVLLTAYPAAQALLDYDSLRLHAFEPGALVRERSEFMSIDDPWRRPRSIFSTAVSGVGTLADKLRVGLLRHEVCKGEMEDLFDHIQQPTKFRLHALGFSDRFIDQFLRPWFGGVFLDRELATSSRIFEFVFRMFSLGDAVLPSDGMQAIPLQLADRLPAESIHLEATVAAIEGTSVVMSDGSRKSARQIVIATEGSTAAKLLGRPDDLDWQSVLCLYFSADEAPLNSKKLVLCGTEAGPINNLTEISSVAPTYAPPGKCLINVSVLQQGADPLAMEQPVRKQLTDWFGTQVDGWSLLRTYHIPFALPSQPIARMQRVIKPVEIGGQPLVCGDHCETASIQGAMNSGIRASEAVLGRLRA